MKQTIIIFIACALFHVSFSQSSTSGSSAASSIILRAGLNLANVSVADNGSVDDAKMLPSFHLGLLADLPVTHYLSLQPGLLFTGKGAKTQYGQPQDANYYKATTNPYYIELPLNAVFKFGMENTKFFVGAGPYVAMGVAGKRKIEGKLLGISFSSKENIEFSNDDPATNEEEGAGLGIIKRFDYGFNGTAGFEGKTAVFAISYGLGLAKLQSGSTNGEDNNNKHRVLSISVGFRL